MEMGVLGKYVDTYMCMHVKIADIEKRRLAGLLTARRTPFG
jgi:hypothetical protein